MTRHSAVRQAIIAALKESDDGTTTFFDGRPVVVEEDELPAVAVYLSDAQCTGADVDGDVWSAVLHVEVFLKAAQPDGALDEQMENRVYPALVNVTGLTDIIRTMSARGYDYQRDDQMAMWGSADLTYDITYTM
ncbi:phage tail protein [Salmonella enterica]|uniref:Phage tail protein n=1 Tax=Salmonella enterica TaxID=28901 RepID=A0A633DHE7_SALER|nr:phage tail protein [Salmonella enterica]EBQ9480447.1 phage tail protein [Salmonella enterica subsp. enterica serovar Kokomlemle]EBS0796813.1 phage tail protein [Salmonella enterica subsp. enterica serovar Overschie]EBW2602011.1 phage tail protein [Salmonella enterica subsp. enterica serovar Poano]EBZ5139225.1 phage tail protein [Salmonella enterica subsp. enterica serovar Antsalova]ECD3472087.1 phage tail protein [Salmonella enterica subsp. enterica serovar Oranienburg]EDL5727670.1 phage t